MNLLSIIKYPDPILKKVCPPVAKVTKEIQQLLEDMTETMYAAPGVGLAAPQVGELKRVIVLDVSWSKEGGKKELYQLVNPKIIERSGEIEWEEGCLSILDFLQTMKRSQKVKVEALNKQGKLIVVEGEDLLAVCLQHEIDHLDGKLIIDKASRLKRKLYTDKVKKNENTLLRL
ncbi:MAG: peptide deformylase [Deltaproteobacteria bacterium RIFCSPLOWO2_12_FULL_44_12]|nr:MAG: peptide deformylase [Deltaproteobacteria bacterium RIFCSPHIGHO2_01_FULL_43_49]OGQ14392.1 MAG: peptide deformylase [Deltaproteobacteria bacterium RIFCSPHIGHO2_02_FULL_44_53]OGQ27568.1 MAG: peptide deformylase [Deltaproteobacteria bacterium RIFCSPHIGHO2_12_FULL_44_21]OGQ30833.1 MAG: peptide deformylase [Deltaproteobacteria bacterium RIFCSPLOWO2_01_FULL_45_74]OGQ42514.1 MAG: peptide deformylase [Deltaproteobacteria bacterium RIFCSPLOWO2_02_FULL_44_34]OGQ69290.1 MAG: peptide deformylase [D